MNLGRSLLGRNILKIMANSDHIRTLLELLLVVKPKKKIDIVFILRNLVDTNVPFETFSNALKDPFTDSDGLKSSFISKCPLA